MKGTVIEIGKGKKFQIRFEGFSEGFPKVTPLTLATLDRRSSDLHLEQLLIC